MRAARFITSEENFTDLGRDLFRRPKHGNQNDEHDDDRPTDRGETDAISLWAGAQSPSLLKAHTASLSRWGAR
jgi:hypothetical protein